MKLGLLLLSLLVAGSLWAEAKPVSASSDTCQNSIVLREIIVCTPVTDLDEKPNPVFKLFKKKQRLNKRITAAALAFPFPFGIVGLHRIYLGTQPHVPVAYIASLGGVFGILPFIDFCAIMLDSSAFESYKNNAQVFMWLKH